MEEILSSYLFAVPNEVLCLIIQGLPLKTVKRLIDQYPSQAERIRFCIRLETQDPISATKLATEIFPIFPYLQEWDGVIRFGDKELDMMSQVSRFLRGSLRLSFMLMGPQRWDHPTSYPFEIAQVRLSLYPESEFRFWFSGRAVIEYEGSQEFLSLHPFSSNLQEPYFSRFIDSLPPISELRVETLSPLWFRPGSKEEEIWRPMLRQPLTHLWVQTDADEARVEISSLLQFLVTPTSAVTDLVFFSTRYDETLLDEETIREIQDISWGRIYPSVLRFHGAVVHLPDLESVLPLFPSLIEVPFRATEGVDILSLSTKHPHIRFLDIGGGRIYQAGILTGSKTGEL